MVNGLSGKTVVRRLYPRSRRSERRDVVPRIRWIWQSISRNAAVWVTLVYIAVVGGRLTVLAWKPWPDGTAAPSATRQDDAVLRSKRGIEAEKRGVQAALMLLPWIIVLTPRNSGMLVLVIGLNTVTVYACAMGLFGRRRGR